MVVPAEMARTTARQKRSSAIASTKRPTRACWRTLASTEGPGSREVSPSASSQTSVSGTK